MLHQANSTTGQVGVALRQLGQPVHIIRALVGPRIPRQVDRFDGLIVFGGPMSANDDHLQGIRTELYVIERWMYRDRPIWGICLGAQLMTRVLGGVVYKHPSEQVEVGWYPIDPVGFGKRILTPLTHVYQWHREGFELPSGASRLASGVDGGLIRERAAALRDCGRNRQSVFFKNAVGSRDQMLVETGNMGHGRNYSRMQLSGDYVAAGSLVDVTVKESQNDLLVVQRC